MVVLDISSKNKNLYRPREKQMKKHNDNTFYEREFKVSVLGVGNVGTKIAHTVLESFPRSLVYLYSKPENVNYLNLIVPTVIAGGIKDRGGEEIPYNRTKSRVSVFRSIDERISTGTDERTIFGSDFIIVSARNSKFPIGKREEEYEPNKPVINDISQMLVGYQGIVVIVTNPTEAICESISQNSGIDRRKIVGLSYTDSLRFISLLKNEADKFPGYKDKPIKTENAFVLGEHGPTLVPIYSLARINGKRLLETKLNAKSVREKIAKDIREGLVDRPVQVQTLKRGATVDTDLPAEAVVKTLDALLKREYVPMSSYDRDLFIGNLSTSTTDRKQIEIKERLVLNQKKEEHISRKERKFYFVSKAEILRKLCKKYKLTTADEALTRLKAIYDERLLDKEDYNPVKKALESK